MDHLQSIRSNVLNVVIFNRAQARTAPKFEHHGKSYSTWFAVRLRSLVGSSGRIVLLIA